MGIEFTWRSAGEPIAHSEPEPPWRSPRVRRRVLIAALAALAVAGALYYRAQRSLAIARAELERVIAAEVLALQTGQCDLFLAALDQMHAPWIRYHEENFAREAAWYAARPTARPRVERLHLGAAQAEVTVLLSDGNHAWRSTWFYQQSEGHWRHAPPPPEFWGDPSELETEHLSVIAQGPDCAPAARLAPALESFCAALTAQYPPAAPTSSDAWREVPRSASRITVRSFPYGASASGVDYFASPQLAIEMWSATDRAAALERSARLSVARAVLQRALGRSQPAAGDWWLVEALALWHAGAWQPDWRPIVQQGLGDGLARTLDVQGLGSDSHSLREGDWAPSADWVEPLAYTLGEYLGLTYQAGQLSALVQAIRPGTSSWDALQRVLGLSRASLEAGWGAFLKEHYGS
ncbi:MAG TPA: hypothetical protein PLJ35_05605 [Anaerolineae bacterium]|nr:hypothetical protein [Anaerolineae bacterium]HOQ98278.1 hypothetical protein [Anaerolineae bacterium]HPL27617.1 hypothetical protein [Anaerolineae bacterium]